MNSVYTRHLLAALLTAGTAAIATPSMAQEPGNWIVRGRVIHVTPNDRSGEVTTLAGSGVGVGDDTTAELDITYMLRPNWGLELILATTSHDLVGKGTIANLGKIGRTALLPPTLTLQYHFAPKANVRPYAGAGVNYSKFYNEKSTNSLDTGLGGPTNINLDDSWGLAAQAGVDVGLKNDWFVNFDLKYIQIETKATLVTGSTTRTVDVDINPWVFGVGIGKRF